MKNPACGLLRGDEMKRIIVVILGLAVIAGAAIVGYQYIAGDNNQQRSITFVEQIKDMNALATSHAFLKTVIDEKDNEVFGWDIDLNIPGTERRVFMVVPGTVLAGIDMDQVSEEDIKVNEENKTLTLQLPRAKLLQEPALKMDEVQAFSEEGIFRSNVNMEEGLEFAAAAQEKMEKEAIEQGVLQRAEINAELALTEFFEHIGYDATITFD
ncbi:hypothetical protein KP77_30170 [Jeotgalibacillus alimentarius]|uniref:DUF4230 domain-containing protein n=1 Tax=Jeotgalibacillus alimentarius TaxID=135826 RepID=A0A0C2VJA1_9BACL|nr:DUF4230 domain-containing protein [Jeotgalibacillus alimentarius]KIL44068.1 hypothetical protein KP77_30170 [Jeotgalibacillus alimentarius]